MSRYFKCEHWYDHFPCYSVHRDPESYLKKEELDEVMVGVLTGKKDMSGILVTFSIPDDYDVDTKFDDVKKKAQEVIKEFTLNQNCYKKVRKVDRKHHWCPEESIVLYTKKKRLTKKTSSKSKKDGKKDE